MKWPIVIFVLAAALALNSKAATASPQNSASTYRATSALAPTVRDLSPSPGDTLKAFFPRLSATIDTHGREPLRRRSLHLFVDGQDVTQSSRLADATISYLPHAHMQAGWHDVFVEGSDEANRTFSEAWVFRTQEPDVDVPEGADNGFAFLPVGPEQGPFTHFFFVSPFDGFGLVQFCGFQFPLTSIAGTPVFFATVPVTLGSVLLGCNPGLFFTPFQAGIGQLNPIFFPIAIAGPGFFRHHHRNHPFDGSPVTPAYRATMPGYQGTMPIYRGTTPAYRGTMPVYQRTAPVYPTQAVPVQRSPVIGLPGSIGVPRTGGVMHPISVPHPISIPHGISIPHPYIPH